MSSPSAEMNVQHPAMTPQQQRLTSQAGLALYRELAVGQNSWLSLLRYELSLLIAAGVPGLLGYGLRSLLFPGLFRRCGKKVAFGKHLVLRNLSNVTLGKKVLIDDFSGLDVRGSNAAIEVGDHVSIGRYTTIAAKQGRITLANGVNIGSYCRIATQSQVNIGESVLIGAYSYIGPGNHQSAEDGSPLISREMEIKGGVTIGAHAWLGARVTVLDGVTIGAGAIIGAHSLVKDNIPPGAIAVGIPAKVVGTVKAAA